MKYKKIKSRVIRDNFSPAQGLMINTQFEDYGYTFLKWFVSFVEERRDSSEQHVTEIHYKCRKRRISIVDKL
jgi:hypothetical protein